MTDITDRSFAATVEAVRRDIADSYDEEIELELEDERLAQLGFASGDGLDRRVYFRELLRLQHELVRLQDWVQHNRLRVVVLFEGRDSAGKGGVIKRITQRLNPRVCRVAALPAPSERERTQWYFQRYVAHLPAGGEIVLFDRSWYKPRRGRTGDGLLHRDRGGGVLPLGARVRAHAGALWYRAAEILVLDHRRGAGDALPDAHPRPHKQWKLSPMDVESRRRWEDYTRRRRTCSPAPTSPRRRGGWSRRWTRSGARLNCIAHLLGQIPYGDVEHPAVHLPDRVRHPDYVRTPVAPRDARAGAVLRAGAGSNFCFEVEITNVGAPFPSARGGSYAQPKTGSVCNGLQ